MWPGDGNEWATRVDHGMLDAYCDCPLSGREEHEVALLQTHSPEDVEGHREQGELHIASPHAALIGQDRLHIDCGDRRQVRLDAGAPALALLAEVDVVVEDLRLLLQGQLTDVHDGAAIGELREIALAEPAARRLVDVLA